MSDNYGSVAKQIAKGAGWTVLMRFGVRGIGLVSTIILARLLVPADFGLVALAMLLVAAVEVMSEFNFDVYLIREQEAGREIYDTVWSLTIIRGAVMAIAMALLAPAAAGFFNEPRIEYIVYLLAAVTFVESLQNVGIVDFRKHMQFDRDFAFLFGAKIVAFAVTIALAFAFRSYWALVIGTMSERVVRLVLSYRLHPFRPRWSLDGWRGIVGFSKWLLLNNILNFVYTRADTFVLGRLAGTTSVGLYSVAYEISNLATTELIAPIRRAIFPGYAKMAHDPDLMRQGYLDILAITLLVTAPVAAGIGLVAGPFVHVVLGAKWLDAIPLIEVLAVYGLVSIAWSNTAPLFLAIGRPQLMTWFISLGVAVVIPALYFGVRDAGVVGAALAVTFSNFVILLVAIFLVLRAIDLRAAKLLGATWRPMASVALMAIGVVAVDRALAPETPEFLDYLIQLATLSLAGAAIYVSALLGLWALCGRPEGAEEQIFRLIGLAWRRIAGGSPTA